MSTLYECRAPGCRAGKISKPCGDWDKGPEFFCRTAGMNEYFRARADGTHALHSDACSPACSCSDDGDFFHDAECAGRLAARERARPEPANAWDEWWRRFLEHVAEHGGGYGGSY